MAAADNEILNKLDEKEKLIFSLMAEGYRTSEISKMLSMSYHDVAEKSRMVKEKLRVTTVLELKNIAVKTGLQKKNT